MKNPETQISLCSGIYNFYHSHTIRIMTLTLPMVNVIMPVFFVKHPLMPENHALPYQTLLPFAEYHTYVL